MIQCLLFCCHGTAGSSTGWRSSSWRRSFCARQQLEQVDHEIWKCLVILGFVQCLMSYWTWRFSMLKVSQNCSVQKLAFGRSPESGGGFWSSLQAQTHPGPSKREDHVTWRQESVAKLGPQLCMIFVLEMSWRQGKSWAENINFNNQCLMMPRSRTWSWDLSLD